MSRIYVTLKQVLPFWTVDGSGSSVRLNLWQTKQSAGKRAKHARPRYSNQTVGNCNAEKGLQKGLQKGSYSKLILVTTVYSIAIERETREDVYIGNVHLAPRAV